MSSKTYKKNVLTYSVDVTMPSMPKSRLPELIEKARKSGLTFRDIRQRSGDQIPLSSLNAWHKGRPPNPNLTSETILALAKGLGEPATVVFEAIIGKTSTGLADETLAQILEDFLGLPARVKNSERLQFLIEMLRAEVQKHLHRDT